MTFVNATKPYSTEQVPPLAPPTQICNNLNQLKPLIRQNLFELISLIVDSVHSNVSLTQNTSDAVDEKQVEAMFESKMSALEDLIIG